MTTCTDLSEAPVSADGAVFITPEDEFRAVVAEKFGGTQTWMYFRNTQAREASIAALEATASEFSVTSKMLYDLIQKCTDGADYEAMRLAFDKQFDQDFDQYVTCAMMKPDALDFNASNWRLVMSLTRIHQQSEELKHKAMILMLEASATRAAASAIPVTVASVARSMTASHRGEIVKRGGKAHRC